MYTNRLVHHGVQGQKWGVRRGPPYPIEDTVLKKGTKLNSVGRDPNSDRVLKRKKTWLYTYNPDDEHDRKVYTGPFSKYLRLGRGAWFVYEHSFETTKDLKMPTSKQRVDEFVNLYSKKQKMVIKDLLEVKRMFERNGTPLPDVDLNNLKTNKDFKNAYEVFNHAMEFVNSNRFKSVNAYKKEMGKKYDAMVDDNNVTIYNRAHDPIIIFDAKKSLKTVSPSRMVTDQEIIDNTEAISKYLEKYGEKVKL